MKRSRKSREINRLKEQNSQKTHMLGWAKKEKKDCKIFLYIITELKEKMDMSKKNQTIRKELENQSVNPRNEEYSLK